MKIFFVLVTVLSLGLLTVGCSESPTSTNNPPQQFFTDVTLAKLSIGDFCGGGKVFFKGHNYILVADTSDLVPPKNWQDAASACRQRGLNWYLPPIDQLKLLWLKKDIVGGFVDSTFWNQLYWSSSLPDGPDSVFWAQVVDFKKGPNTVLTVAFKSSAYNVRAVKKIFINYKISYDM